MTSKRTFKLFANCKVVLGALNATINDLHRGRVYSIPRSLGTFLSENSNINTQKYIQEKWEEDKKTILEYLEFLESKELGFWTNEPEKFPDLNHTWKSPEHINNAIIEIEKLSFENIRKIAQALNALLCKHVEIRCYKNASIDKIDFFASNFVESTLKSIVVFLPMKENKIPEIEKLSLKFPRIALIILHSAKDNSSTLSFKSQKIKTITRTVDNRTHCGIIEPNMFSIKIPVFMESLEHNSCLNKKLSVDMDGEIKNCPSMRESFGNVADVNIEEIAKSDSFRKTWKITKDTIGVCRDCEYRRVCTDCRAYVDNPKDIHSKPLKCGYDPYKGEWSDWSKNPLKKETIQFYNI